ncbi:hypothetical protein LguiB_016210 [Lonicera macranthoides]
MIAAAASSSAASSSSAAVRMVCRNLISFAIQRCRMLDDHCRLSIVLKSSPFSNPPVLRISISDTGVGSSLEEIHDLKYTSDSFSAEKWVFDIYLTSDIASIADGVISVATTSISDNKIYHYTINLKESAPTKRLKKLPSNSKNGAKFRHAIGHSFHAHFEESCEFLLLLKCLLRRIRRMNLKIAVELVVDGGDVPRLRCENFMTALKIISSSMEIAEKIFVTLASQVGEIKQNSQRYGNIEMKMDGVGGYFRKNIFFLLTKLNKFTNYHLINAFGLLNNFPPIIRECLKVGSGVACCTETCRTNGWVVEVVMIISESSEQTSPSCLRACGSKTEVLYFRDFSPCPIPHSSLNALTSIDWKTYGLTLRSMADQDGSALLEWENLPPHCLIDIAIHCYYKQYPSLSKQKSQLNRTLTQKAVKLALDDLKYKNAGVLLSAHALKIRSYAPDLARTLAGLILSSNDSNFKEECVSLLGLECEEIEKEIVNDRIKERIISVVELNDRKPQRSKEAETFLFENDYFQEPDFMDEEYEEAFGSLDL